MQAYVSFCSPSETAYGRPLLRLHQGQFQLGKINSALSGKKKKKRWYSPYSPVDVSRAAGMDKT